MLHVGSEGYTEHPGSLFVMVMDVGSFTAIAAPSGALGSGDSQGRNPPLFISLAAIRQARKSAAALLAANAVVVDTHMRAKPKAKQAAVSGTVHEPLPTGPKQK